MLFNLAFQRLLVLYVSPCYLQYLLSWHIYKFRQNRYCFAFFSIKICALLRLDILMSYELKYTPARSSYINSILITIHIYNKLSGLVQCSGVLYVLYICMQNKSFAFSSLLFLLELCSILNSLFPLESRRGNSKQCSLTFSYCR